jgi:ubiquinone/menaquinone biosynthesis C-methylase UbiE
MTIPDYKLTYERHFEKLAREHSYDKAMELIVGGKYSETGRLEACLLKELGIGPGHSIVDVGCGSGRLAQTIQNDFAGKYWGVDVLREALEFAKSRCSRKDWEFLPTSGAEIPVATGVADFVVFFSVATHLLDEDLFRYMQEARRVAKASARIVISFLDFECEAHWPLFLRTVADRDPGRVLNKFTTKGALRRLARGAGLNVQMIRDGAEKWLRIDDPIACEDGRVLQGMVEFGQSIAVLGVFPEAQYLDRYADVRRAVESGLFESGSHHYDVCGHKEGRSIEG